MNDQQQQSRRHFRRQDAELLQSPAGIKAFLKENTSYERTSKDTPILVGAFLKFIQERLYARACEFAGENHNVTPINMEAARRSDPVLAALIPGQVGGF